MIIMLVNPSRYTCRLFIAVLTVDYEFLILIYIISFGTINKFNTHCWFDKIKATLWHKCMYNLIYNKIIYYFKLIQLNRLYT